MSRLESAEKIEALVGATRHNSLHLARAVSAEQRVYVLHSAECVAAGIDLRQCAYSKALDNGIEMDEWEHWQDRPVVVKIDPDYDELTPWPMPAPESREWCTSCPKCHPGRKIADPCGKVHDCPECADQRTANPS